MLPPSWLTGHLLLLPALITRYCQGGFQKVSDTNRMPGWHILGRGWTLNIHTPHIRCPPRLKQTPWPFISNIPPRWFAFAFRGWWQEGIFYLTRQTKKEIHEYQPSLEEQFTWQHLLELLWWFQTFFFICRRSDLTTNSLSNPSAHGMSSAPSLPVPIELAWSIWERFGNKSIWHISTNGEKEV